MMNFRPNIVVKGCKASFDEDNWDIIKFKSANSNNDDIDISIEANSDDQGIVMKSLKNFSWCNKLQLDHLTGVSDPDYKLIKLLKTFRTGAILGKSGKPGDVIFYFLI